MQVGLQRNSEKVLDNRVKHQEAMDLVLGTFLARLPKEDPRSFSAHEKEYPISSPIDCVVATAQRYREIIEALRQDIVAQNDYYAEQAVAKLSELFVSYEKTVKLNAELHSSYPEGAKKLEEFLPALSAVVVLGEEVSSNVRK